MHGLQLQVFYADGSDLMPLHDFECRACGHTERNLFFHHQSIPKLKRCPACKKKESRQIFDQWGSAQIDLDNPALYGRWHPQMGEVIRDYNHKRQLMRRYGMAEGSDPVRGNRKLSEEVFDDDGQPEPTMEGLSWGDREDVEKAVKNRKEHLGVR